ncbi:major capsid protein [Candidatus Pacearchaeota archaeon]|nr:major capsid protein [Candidatus Pacearchaeota archaeon]
MFDLVALNDLTRHMVGMFDETDVISVPTGGQAFFGRPETGAVTHFSPDIASVEMDIIRGNEKTAVLIPRLTSGRPLGPTQKNIAQQKYTNVVRAFPLSIEEIDITSGQLLQRQANENPYAATTREQRNRLLATKGYNEAIRRHARMFERLCWQSLIEGVMDAILGTTNTDEQYDFYRNSALTFTVANAWDTGSATIMADIDLMVKRLRRLGHVRADMGIIGTDAFNAMINDADFLAIADNRRIAQATISPDEQLPSKFQRFVDAGLDLRGRMQTASGKMIWLFTYDEVYEDASGTPVEYMPLDKMLICSSTARCDRYFGPSDVLPMDSMRAAWINEVFGIQPGAEPIPTNIMNPGGIIMPEMFHVDATGMGNNRRRTLEVESAPIFATTQTDGFGVLDGLMT